MERQKRQKRHAGEIIPPAPPCFCLPASPVRQDRVNGKIMPEAKGEGESGGRKEVSQRTGRPERQKKTLSGLLLAPCCSPQLSGNPSFDTTVRRRPDRSRPPQVGPTGHTCTASADRTAHAKRPPRNRGLPNARASSATRPAFPPAPAERRSLRRKHGGPGGIISPGGARGSAPRAPTCPSSSQSCLSKCVAARRGRDEKGLQSLLPFFILRCFKEYIIRPGRLREGSGFGQVFRRRPAGFRRRAARARGSAFGGVGAVRAKAIFQTKSKKECEREFSRP